MKSKTGISLEITLNIFECFIVSLVNVSDQRVTNNNVIQSIAMPIATIRYLQIRHIE